MANPQQGNPPQPGPQAASDRRWGLGAGVAIGVGAALLLLVIVGLIAVFALGRCPMCGRMMNGGMMGNGAMGPGMMMQDGQMPDWMMSRGGMDRQMMDDMQPIHALLMNHEKIRRQVQDIPGGIESRTTSEDPEIAGLIRRHVRQMKRRVEQGEPIRMMDPVFREIFEHQGKIEMQVEDIPGGVRVIEMSEDPQVVRIIRQHAHRAVSEFVEQGMPRAMQPTPLPQGYGE